MAIRRVTRTFAGPLLILSMVACLTAQQGPPSPEQQQTNSQLYPMLNSLLEAAHGLPDNASLPTNQNASLNPLLPLVLQVVKNMATETNNSSRDHNATASDGGMGVSGQSISTLMKDKLMQELLGIVVNEIEGAKKSAVEQNITISGSPLSLVNPLNVLRQLLSSDSAQLFIQTITTGVVSDACRNDLMETLNAAMEMKGWALEMFDAFGKPSPGVQRGSFYFVGSYDQCYKIKPDISNGNKQGLSRDFHTSFCRTDFKIPESFKDALHVDTKGVHLKLTVGMCVPDTCHSSDLIGLLENGLNISIENSYCHEDTQLQNDTSAIICIVILSIFGLLILIGTIYDAFKSKATQERNKPSATKPLTTERYTLREDKRRSQAKNSSLDQSTLIPAKLTNGDLGDGVKNVNGRLPAGYVHHKEGKENGHVTVINITDTDVNKPQVAAGKECTEIIPKTEATTGASKKPNESIVERIALCFSLYTNIPKILSARSSSGSVSCIHGIRFLSLTWVMLGHTYNYGIISEQETFTADNLLDFVPIMQRVTFQGVVAGGYAVDTFFVLSAFLLTWLQLKSTSKKTKKFSLMDGVMYYFHRFWRLTPIYMFVLMTFACLYPYFGEGPMWPSKLPTADNCKMNWWTNLLYVNNLVETDNQCMSWTWYLANDMQFYVITPIFLFLMYKFVVFGALSTSLLMIFGISMAYWQESIVNGNFFTMMSDGGAFWNKVYTVPWCRVSPWAVGMLLGLIVFRRGRKPFRNKMFALIGWLLATTVALFLVYITYTENKENGTEWTNIQRALYESIGRAAWGICIAWLIFACYSGMGGIVDTILSWNGFIPLSRLSYAAYLVHPICMMTYVFSRRTLLHVNDYNIVYLYLGHLSVTYMVSFAASLAFEAPFMALEKILFR